MLGVLLGTVIVGAFFTFSAVVIAWVGKTNPKTVMMAALFAYVIKVLVLAIDPDDDADRRPGRRPLDGRCDRPRACSSGSART